MGLKPGDLIVPHARDKEKEREREMPHEGGLGILLLLLLRGRRKPTTYKSCCGSCEDLLPSFPSQNVRMSLKDLQTMVVVGEVQGRGRRQLQISRRRRHHSRTSRAFLQVDVSSGLFLALQEAKGSQEGRGCLHRLHGEAKANVHVSVFKPARLSFGIGQFSSGCWHSISRALLGVAEVNQGNRAGEPGSHAMPDAHEFGPLEMRGCKRIQCLGETLAHNHNCIISDNCIIHDNYDCSEQKQHTDNRSEPGEGWVGAVSALLQAVSSLRLKAVSTL